jgi:hypothetical protein
MCGLQQKRSPCIRKLLPLEREQVVFQEDAASLCIDAGIGKITG